MPVASWPRIARNDATKCFEGERTGKRSAFIDHLARARGFISRERTRKSRRPPVLCLTNTRNAITPASFSLRRYMFRPLHSRQRAFRRRSSTCRAHQTLRRFRCWRVSGHDAYPTKL